MLKFVHCFLHVFHRFNTIRQENTGVVAPGDEYFLGRSLDASRTALNADTFSEIYVDGTVCDLTGEAREVEVQVRRNRACFTTTLMSFAVFV